jgi:protein-disulfide isomerase
MPLLWPVRADLPAPPDDGFRRHRHPPITQHDVAFVGRGDWNESADAALAATCAAGQGRYWEYHDLLFWNQHGENESAFSDERLGAMADRLGLDRTAWDACRSDPKQAKAVDATTSQALAKGINRTPTLVLNGTPVAGLPRSYDDLARAIHSAAGSSSTTPASPASAP